MKRGLENFDKIVWAIRVLRKRKDIVPTGLFTQPVYSNRTLTG